MNINKHKIMEILKLILSIELLAMFVCGVINLIVVLFKQEFPFIIYPFIAGIVLIGILLVLYIFAPPKNKFFN